MLQRTRGDHRVWNRITALKEAYIRATSKKHDLPKKPKFVSNPLDKNKKKKELMLKHSFAATKIRAELEKYDELPASSPTIDDDYDETCSVKFKPPRHHRSVPNLPRTPSTAHRLVSFVTSIKKRAQSNVQQLQKNLHDIRSRVHIESMMTPAKHIDIPSSTRQKQILKVNFILFFLSIYHYTNRIFPILHEFIEQIVIISEVRKQLINNVLLVRNRMLHKFLNINDKLFANNIDRRA